MQVSRDMLTFGKLLYGTRFINLGISSNLIKDVLWCARDIRFLPSLQNIVILCGTNDINKDASYDISFKVWILSVHYLRTSSMTPIYLSEEYSSLMIFFSVNRLVINKIIDFISCKCFRFQVSINGKRWSLYKSK